MGQINIIAMQTRNLSTKSEFRSTKQIIMTE